MSREMLHLLNVFSNTSSRRDPCKIVRRYEKPNSASKSHWAISPGREKMRVCETRSAKAVFGELKLLVPLKTTQMMRLNPMLTTNNTQNMPEM
jgi:hypothetical protein